jgi:hypothetical protein
LERGSGGYLLIEEEIRLVSNTGRSGEILKELYASWLIRAGQEALPMIWAINLPEGTGSGG